MTDLTPADLAKFVHPVPVGATIPAGMEYAVVIDDGLYVTSSMADHAPRGFRCWTAEPLAAPKPPLTERIREFANEVLNAPAVGFSSTQNRWIAEAASILAEIAERLDADR